MPINENLNLFDQINTTAARWLIWNSKERKQLLGIREFSRKDKTHLWLLRIMNAFSVAAGYEDFYLDCSWIDFLYVRYIMKMDHVKKMNGKVDAFLIESKLFAKEVCNYFAKEEKIVEDIYDEYWGD